MILFDPGVLMGSACQSIFDEYVEMHPGAVNLKKAHAKGCSCGKPACFRHYVQRISRHLGEDKEKFSNLLNACAEADGVEATDAVLLRFLGQSQGPFGKGLLSSWLTNFKSH